MNEREEKRRKKTFRKKRKTGGGRRINWANKRQTRTKTSKDKQERHAPGESCIIGNNYLFPQPPFVCTFPATVLINTKFGSDGNLKLIKPQLFQKGSCGVEDGVGTGCKSDSERNHAVKRKDRNRQQKDNSRKKEIF